MIWGCVMGFVYLLRFDRPISEGHTTQHYLGYTRDLPARIEAHKTGQGARLCQVANERGIAFKVARIWRGDRELERQLKRRKCHRRIGRGWVDELSRQEIDELLGATS